MTTTAGDVTTAAATCPEGHGVTLVTITGAGHQWPAVSRVRERRSREPG